MSKKFILAWVLTAMALPAAVHAAGDNKKSDNKLFEEAVTRFEEPLTKVYVHPQIADMQMISAEREVFGPYRFKLEKSMALTNYDLENFKARALYRATMESDADLMIAPLYDSYINESNDKELVVELSGYPAKFVNFRPLPLNDNTLNAIGVCYPVVNTSVSVSTPAATTAQPTDGK